MGCADGLGKRAWRIVSVALPSLLLAGSPAVATTLTDVVVSPGSPVSVRIEPDAEAAAKARMLEADATHPPRLTIDLRGVTLDPATPRAVAGSGPIVRARTGQFRAETARVVLDLRETVPFDVWSEDCGVVIALGTAEEEGGPQPTPGPAMGPASPSKSRSSPCPEGLVAFGAPPARRVPNRQTPSALRAAAPAKPLLTPSEY